MVRLGELMMILELHRQGVSITAIARRTGRDPKTVRKYRGGPGLLDSLAATISYSLVPITPPVSCSPPSPPPGHAPAVVMAD